MSEIEMTPTVHATQMPKDVEDWCVDHDISTHYQNDITYIENDGNPFANWLKDMGYVFGDDGGGWIGIFAS